MSTNISLEERLAALEAAITEIQEQLTPLQSNQSNNWLQQITGSFQDEPAFEEVLAYGKAIRRADEMDRSQKHKLSREIFAGY